MGLFGSKKPWTEEEEGVWNNYTWQRLIELGMATEEYTQACIENPEPGDREGLVDIAVDEAAYHSAPWWKKVWRDGI